MAMDPREVANVLPGMQQRNFPPRRRPIGVKKPLPEPTTVSHVFVMLIMHICRRIILFEPEIKVTIYLGALVFGSLVTDFLPVPKSYFSQKSNVFNRVFVKWGWGWTLFSVGSYLGATSYVYCCGNLDRIRRHFYRLMIASIGWFSWTRMFVVVENATSACYNDKYSTKSSCLQHGSTWGGFDISGHAFILIYCCLIMAEEAKSIRGWDRIGELIRNDEFEEDSPLRSLTPEQMRQLQFNYERLTPFVRITFILMTILFVLWDAMLVATILYFHHMVQKVIAGCIAIMIWYCTYRWWFTLAPPGLPGQGLFKYSNVVPIRNRRSSISRVPQTT